MTITAKNVLKGRTLRPRFSGVLGMAAALHATLAATARAQTPATLPGDGGGILPWAVAGVIAVVVCLTAFLNAKRSHMT